MKNFILKIKIPGALAGDRSKLRALGKKYIINVKEKHIQTLQETQITYTV